MVSLSSSFISLKVVDNIGHVEKRRRSLKDTDVTAPGTVHPLKSEEMVSKVDTRCTHWKVFLTKVCRKKTPLD